jgi:hypothetical protein
MARALGGTMTLTHIVQTAPLGVFLIALAFTGAFAGIGIYAGFRSWQQQRALRAVAVVPVASAPQAYIRVEGFAEPLGEEPKLAPLTQSPVCWYRFLVEDSATGSSRDAISWRHLDGDSSSAVFYVRDGTGRVLVDPTGADVTPTDRSIWYGATPEPEDRNPRRFPPGQNPKGDIIQIEWSGAGSHRYRYTEERIYPGDPIFVQGELRLEDVRLEHEESEEDGDEDTELAVNEQPCIGKPRRGRQPFMIATTSPAEMINIHRWAIIGTAIIALLGLAAMIQLVRLRIG